MTTLAPGTQLGPYEILAPIGAGGMGEVYKAADRRLERTVAMKLLPRHWAENTEMRQRFEREAQIIASLNHTARGDALEPAIPQEIVRIFANNTPHTGGDYQFYAVSTDGKRILMGQLAGFAGTAGAAAAIGPDPGRPYIAVAMNWAASLKK